MVKHVNFENLMAAIIFQRFYPQSILYPMALQYMKIVGLTEILIKLSSLLFSIGVVAVIIKTRWDIRSMGVNVYVPPPTKTRR